MDKRGSTCASSMCLVVPSPREDASMVPDDGQLPAKQFGRARKIGRLYRATSRPLPLDTIGIGGGCIPLLTAATFANGR